MDAGLAAVLGAAIGGLTALITSWFGFRSARLQLQHQESESARQRRFESLTERRGPRSQAYAEFVAAGQDLIDALYGQEREIHEQFEGLWEIVRKRRSTVAIAGPDHVVKAAGEFADEVRSFRNELVHRRNKGDPFNEKHHFERRLDAFTKAARTALEDEGHPTGGPSTTAAPQA